jgi:ligand-binding sensor domain-containing protein
VNTILQDSKGNIWFGTNGMGAFRYDGTRLTSLSEKDGLCNNFVQCMLEDKTGTLWFGSRFGGLSRYEPGTGKFVTFTTKEGLSTDFIWTLLEDKNVPDGAVGIWISAVAGGLCRYDSEKDGVSVFKTTEGLTSKHVQSIFRDKNDRLWLGCSGGLFRWKESQNSFVNVKRIGPWE